MPTTQRAGHARTTVTIHGPALRALRKAYGIEIVTLAEQVGVTRSYITKLELGYSRQVSVTVYRALGDALPIEDRRAILANPGADIEAADDDQPAA